jgi:hypothetical protein
MNYKGEDEIERQEANCSIHMRDKDSFPWDGGRADETWAALVTKSNMNLPPG